MMSPGRLIYPNTIRAAFAGLLLISISWACGNGGADVNGWDQAKLAAPASYKEGDSFPAASLPPAISAWLYGYAKLDSGIRMHHFRNSGVPLHIGQLDPASVPPGYPGQAISPLVVFSPDSSRAIDYTSYGSFPDTSREGQVSWKGGEADQEVVLLLVREGKRLQLMFNGPQTVLEAAGWLNNDACLVGLIQQDAAKQRFYPELMLFNFRDSTFTNFRTPGDFPLELLMQEPADFPEGKRPQNSRHP